MRTPTRNRTFSPTLNASRLESRSLLSTFGGGNFDDSRPFITNKAVSSAGINFTSNAYHQIETAIDGIAGSIVKNSTNPSSVLNQLDKITSKVPFGRSLKSILVADLQALQAGSTISDAQASTVVTDLYSRLLGRSPDVVAFQVDVPALKTGTTVQQLAQTIVTSTEYLGDNTRFATTVLEARQDLVGALYENILGPDSETFETDYWVGQINAGVDPRSVASAIVYSAEASMSTAGLLHKVPALSTTIPTYYFGVPNPDGGIAGPFRGTSSQAKVANLILADLNHYLDQGEGVRFNVLKSHQSFSTDVFLTFNGRVR